MVSGFMVYQALETTASKFLKKLFNKSLLIDGDMVRKYVSTDLSYTLSLD